MATAIQSSDDEAQNGALCMYYTLENCKNNRESISKTEIIGLCPSNHVSYKAYKEMTQSTPARLTSSATSDEAAKEIPVSSENTFQQPSSSTPLANIIFPFSTLSASTPPFVPKFALNNTELHPTVSQTATVEYESCEYCKCSILHPTDQEQRNRHIVHCVGQYERSRQMSFAIQKSEDKQCNICYENVINKENPGNRFGILLNCWHVFCLECIRKWRTSRQFENEIIRACPVCRIASDFVCPSNFWVETKEEKDKLLANYRRVLSRVDCRYFKFGTGICRFGNKCFYRHCDEFGEHIDAGAPTARRPRRDQSRNMEHLIRSQADEIDQIGRLLLLEFARGTWFDSDDYDSDTS